MKIAVWISFNYLPSVGGTFSYVNKLIKSIDEYDFHEELDVCFAATYYIKVGNLQRELIRVGSPLELLLSKIPYISKKGKYQDLHWRLFSHNYHKILKKKGIRLLLYSSQFVKQVPDFPFIASHWDIAHRSTYAFPEFSFVLHKKRERYYNDFLPKALMIFVESNAGKEELIRYTCLNEERIRVVPIFPGECASFSVTPQQQISIIKDFQLEKNKYFYYPSQFLAEKNHYSVLKAFSMIASKYPSYKIIFSGNSPKTLLGTIDYIKASVKELGLTDKVVFAGFVSLETVYSLYKNACAHIMASYVGPTNMPPLEAMSIGCPVICSDISGHREEMKDAALYFKANNPSQLAIAMEEMINNREFYLHKIQQLSLVSEFTIENALDKMNKHLLEASVIRSTWE